MEATRRKLHFFMSIGILVFLQFMKLPIRQERFMTKKMMVAKKMKNPQHQYPDLLDWFWNLSANRYSSPSSASLTTASFPLPLEALERYRHWHSVEALREDYRERHQNNNFRQRKFAIGIFACPKSAGQRVKDLVDIFLLSVLTNRTFLAKFWDEKACRNMPEVTQNCGQLRNCKDFKNRHVNHCKQILKFRSWVPNYDVWAPKIPDWDGRVHFESTQSSYPVVWFKDNIFPEKLTLPGEYEEKVASELYQWGADFARGASYRYLLNYGKDFQASVYHSKEAKEEVAMVPSTVTLGLHARHSHPDDDGCDVSRNLACLEKLLKHWQQKRSSVKLDCQIYVMSDRECTIPSLRSSSIGQTCTIHNVDHSTQINGIGYKNAKEHGPFAGAGFFRDLIYVTDHTRHGFVAGHIPGSYYNGQIRTSSVLVLQNIEFHRRMEAWHDFVMSEGIGGSSFAVAHHPHHLSLFSEQKDSDGDSLLTCMYTECHVFQELINGTCQGAPNQKNNVPWRRASAFKYL